LGSTTMSEKHARDEVDQPFVQAGSFNGNERVYVGGNDFAAASGKTATVDVRLPNTPAPGVVKHRVESRATLGQNGPSVRPAVSRDGTVYAAFFGWRQANNNLITSDIVVVRDDHGAVDANAFLDLTDPSDNKPGRLVATGRTIPWSNAQTLGQERIGSTLSIAVHPSQSGIVYICWGDREGNGDIYSLHVRRSTDRGATWSPSDIRTIKDATCGSLAIADNGAVCFLYQQVSNGRWLSRIEQTLDGFQHFRQNTLARTPVGNPVPMFLPYIGDYSFVLAVGNEFRGIFSASNIPDNANFPSGVRYQRNADFAAKKLLRVDGSRVEVSIDPFFFSIPAIAQP